MPAQPATRRVEASRRVLSQHEEFDHLRRLTQHGGVVVAVVGGARGGRDGPAEQLQGDPVAALRVGHEAEQVRGGGVVRVPLQHPAAQRLGLARVAGLEVFRGGLDFFGEMHGRRLWPA